MDLNRDAMLVGLRITAWSGRLYDREASDHVAAHHDASASAGRYNKRLLPKAAFAALTSIMSEARTKHYENSLPWDDKGARLLTVTNYAHYTELMNALRERVVRQRARFIEDYDDYVDQARLDLGKLFRIEDYPSNSSGGTNPQTSSNASGSAPDPRRKPAPSQRTMPNRQDCRLAQPEAAPKGCGTRMCRMNSMGSSTT